MSLLFVIMDCYRKLGIRVRSTIVDSFMWLFWMINVLRLYNTLQLYIYIYILFLSFLLVHKKSRMINELTDYADIAYNSYDSCRNQFVIAIERAPVWTKLKALKTLSESYLYLYCDCHRICAWYDVINRLWVVFLKYQLYSFCIFCVSRINMGYLLAVKLEIQF
jgi:hypothetical protein